MLDCGSQIAQLAINTDSAGSLRSFSAEQIGNPEGCNIFRIFFYIILHCDNLAVQNK